MKNIYKLVLVLCVGVQSQSIDAQVTFEGNDATAPPGSFVGWDNSVSDPLEVRHDGNRPILFSTNGNENMEIASYRNVGVGTQGVAIRPKFYSRLTPANAPLRWVCNPAAVSRQIKFKSSNLLANQ
jgi:hypothetical protein